MQKIRSHISILMLVLLLFPLAEKARHDLKHINDKHCSIRSMHYCQAEHSCPICDYIFFSSLRPPKIKEKPVLFAGFRVPSQPLAVAQPPTSFKLVLSLRGPPVAIRPYSQT